MTWIREKIYCPECGSSSYYDVDSIVHSIREIVRVTKLSCTDCKEAFEAIVRLEAYVTTRKIEQTEEGGG